MVMAPQNDETVLELKRAITESKDRCNKEVRLYEKCAAIVQLKNSELRKLEEERMCLEEKYRRLEKELKKEKDQRFWFISEKRASEAKIETLEKSNESLIDANQRLQTDNETLRQNNSDALLKTYEVIKALDLVQRH
jgi:hypothetical protein